VLAAWLIERQRNKQLGTPSDGGGLANK
jgi:hypothetical protein